MGREFFDERLLQTRREKQISIKDSDSISYHLKKIEDHYSLFVELGEERLNSTELKKVLDAKKFNSDEHVLLTYLVHRLGLAQTRHKLITDVELVFSHLKKAKNPVFLEDKKVSFQEEPYKLSLEVNLDDQSNIFIEPSSFVRPIFASDCTYIYNDGVIGKLSTAIPNQFYSQLFTGKNKFSIDSYLKLQESLVQTIDKEHKLIIAPEVLELQSLKKEEKIAPLVLEIARGTRFISLSLRYKIGTERFPIEKYMYAENASFLDKSTHIKTIREEDTIIEYISDKTLSEDTFRTIFAGTRIRISPSQRNPFTVMVPIMYMDYFVKQVLPDLEVKFSVDYKDGNKLKIEDGKVEFELETNLKSRLDLFEFSVKFKVGSEYFDLEFLKGLMLENRKFIQLKDGTTVNIENVREINKWIEFLGKLEFKKKDGKYTSKSTLALELDEFLKEFGEKNLKSNEEYKNIILELKEKKPVEEINLPKGVKDVLRDYQREGAYWMHFLKKYEFGGILADEMGLGKTIQALTVLDMNKEEGTHIVVCPKTLLFNWEAEVKKYFPHLKCLVISGDATRRRNLITKDANKYDLVITSYSMLQKDYSEYIDVKLEFNYMILDEAHYVKNMKTLSSKAVRLVKSKRTILLTGTPLENNLEELYGTFELIMPGYLGSKLDFKREFVSKIERNNMIALELLQAKIRPFILRRTKSQVLKELPEKQEQVVYSEMTNKQVAIYNEILNRVKIETQELVKEKGFDKVRLQVLSALLKLRQVCNHPSLLDESFKGEEDISGKYNQFLELLEEVVEGEEKVLVFSQFTSMLDIFEKELDSMKIKYVRLDGSTKNRQEVVESFNEDESVKVFLISLKAGGVGLNLTAASAVFMYDPWWNPMAEQQAVDRAHRIGQTKTVNIYKFITKNSIEEKILKLQERKGNLFDNLVNEDQGFMKRLEWEDLMELFEE